MLRTLTPAVALVATICLAQAAPARAEDANKSVLQGLQQLQDTLDLLTREPEGDGALPPAEIIVYAAVELGTWEIEYGLADPVALSGHRITVPVGVAVDLNMTARDIVYEVAFPTLGLAFDTIPGRISQIRLVVDQAGLYRATCGGVCPEAYWTTPLEIEAIPARAFEAWIAAALAR